MIFRGGPCKTGDEVYFGKSQKWEVYFANLAGWEVYFRSFPLKIFKAKCRLAARATMIPSPVLTHTVSSVFHLHTHKVFFFVSAVCCLLVRPASPRACLVSIRLVSLSAILRSSLCFRPQMATYDFDRICIFLQRHLFSLAAMFAPYSFPTLLQLYNGLGSLHVVCQLSSTLMEPHVFKENPQKYRTPKYLFSAGGWTWDSRTTTTIYIRVPTKVHEPIDLYAVIQQLCNQVPSFIPSFLRSLLRSVLPSFLAALHTADCSQTSPYDVPQPAN